MSYIFSYCSCLFFGLYELLFSLLAGEGIAQQRDHADYRIVAYAGGEMDMWQMEASKITHINYAFANVNEEGEIYFRNAPGAAQQLARLQKLKAKNQDLKLLVSVGGWGADGFSDAGIPSRKIMVGVAFYGRSWFGVTPESHGLYQPYEKFYRFIAFSKLTKSYINKNGFKRYWDKAAKAPYLWNADKQIMVAYDDSVSLRHKAEYIKENNLGGVMYWHHSYDPSQQLLDTLYKKLIEQD